MTEQSTFKLQTSLDNGAGGGCCEMPCSPLKVLVACEYSGTIREAFAARGHDATSCDILPTDTPGQHYQGDVRDVLHYPWDLMIFHAPCTDICVSGSRYFKQKRMDGRQQAGVSFFMELWRHGVQHIPMMAAEQPIGVISSLFRKPDQIIQPHQYGHPESKATCLWLHGLPKLEPTEHAAPDYLCECGYRFDYSLGKYGCANCEGDGDVKPIWKNQTASGQNNLPPTKDRAKLRSKTYQGIAEAMATQWGNR